MILGHRGFSPVFPVKYQFLPAKKEQRSPDDGNSTPEFGMMMDDGYNHKLLAKNVVSHPKFYNERWNNHLRRFTIACPKK